MVEGEASTSGDNLSLHSSASPCPAFLLAPETFALLSSFKTLKFFLNSKALHMLSPVPDMFFSIVLVVGLLPLSYKFIHFACFVNIYINLQAPPLSMGFSRQEYWGGLPFPSPGDLHPGIEPMSLNLSCIGGRILYH